MLEYAPTWLALCFDKRGVTAMESRPDCGSGCGGDHRYAGDTRAGVSAKIKDNSHCHSSNAGSSSGGGG